MYQALGLLSETNAISVETAGIISRRREKLNRHFAFGLFLKNLKRFVV